MRWCALAIAARCCTNCSGERARSADEEPAEALLAATQPYALSCRWIPGESEKTLVPAPGKPDPEVGVTRIDVFWMRRN